MGKRMNLIERKYDDTSQLPNCLTHRENLLQGRETRPKEMTILQINLFESRNYLLRHNVAKIHF